MRREGWPVRTDIGVSTHCGNGMPVCGTVRKRTSLLRARPQPWPGNQLVPIIWGIVVVNLPSARAVETYDDGRVPLTARVNVDLCSDHWIEFLRILGSRRIFRSRLTFGLCLLFCRWAFDARHIDDMENAVDEVGKPLTVG